MNTFAFLVLEEHPYGREMLRILLENGFIPAVIIQEVSAVGDEERGKFLDRITGQPAPPRLTELITGSRIPVYCVSNHNDPVCQELLEQFKPDLLVLDLKMPKMDGYDVIKHLKAGDETKEIPIVVITASELGRSRSKSMILGANEYFTKPFSKKEFVAGLKRALEDSA